jgi:hypothetical protein
MDGLIARSPHGPRNPVVGLIPASLQTKKLDQHPLASQKETASALMVPHSDSFRFLKPSQVYRVYATMPVRVLHYRIALQVLRVDPRGIRLFVEDRILFHRGTISDQFDPDHQELPTPYLVPNTLVEVRLVPIGPFGPAPMPLPPPLDLLRPDDDMEDNDGWVLPDPSLIATLGSDAGFSGDSDTPREVSHEEQQNDGLETMEAVPVEVQPITRQRVSSRIRNMRETGNRTVNDPEVGIVHAPRRLVRDRWFYDTENPPIQDSSLYEPMGTIAHASSSIERGEIDDDSLTPDQIHQLTKRFQVEGRNRRHLLRARVLNAWETKRNASEAIQTHNHTPMDFSTDIVQDEDSHDGIPHSCTQRVTMTPHEAMYGPSHSGDNDVVSETRQALNAFLASRLDSGGIRDINVVFDEFLDLQLREFDSILQDNKRLFLDDIHHRVRGGVTSSPPVCDELRQQRTMALWAGLRRVYFAEPDHDDPLINDSPDPSLAYLSHSRCRRIPRVPEDLDIPGPIHAPPDDPDDSSTGSVILVERPVLDNEFETSVPRDFSNGEGKTREPVSVKSWKIRPCPPESDADWHLTNHQWNMHHDKYEAAVAAEMGPMLEPLPTMSSGELTSGEGETRVISDMGEQSKRGVTSPAKAEVKKLLLFSEESPKQFDAAKGFLNNEKFVAGNCPITNGPGKFIGKANATDGNFIAHGPIEFLQKAKAYFASKLPLLSIKTMRRILAAKESIHKYGVFVPRNYGKLIHRLRPLDGHLGVS